MVSIAMLRQCFTTFTSNSIPFLLPTQETSSDLPSGVRSLIDVCDNPAERNTACPEKLVTESKRQ
jgi:hypothetical protein